MCLIVTITAAGLLLASLLSVTVKENSRSVSDVTTGVVKVGFVELLLLNSTAGPIVNG